MVVSRVLRENRISMPPVLSEEALLHVERWLRQADLETISFGHNRADVLVTLVDEKIRDILCLHEITVSNGNDAEQYEYFKDVIRRTYYRPVSGNRPVICF